MILNMVFLFVISNFIIEMLVVNGLYLRSGVLNFVISGFMFIVLILNFGIFFENLVINV